MLFDNRLDVTIASGDALDVRDFSVFERMSTMFRIELVVLCKNPSINFDAVIGQPASFSSIIDTKPLRTYNGICTDIQQMTAEDTGYSTYRLTILPTLWFTTQRRNHRMFQQISEPDIVKTILDEWGIDYEMRIDAGAYKTRKYRVQYAESDFAFMARLLEDSGISYFFDETSKLILSDAPQTGPSFGEVPFYDTPTGPSRGDMVWGVSISQRVRPGKYVIRDHDYRKTPDYPLLAGATGGLGPELPLERFHYVPGAFLFGSSEGEATPFADDKGKTRTDEKEGAQIAKRRLEAKRATAKKCTFNSNAYDLAPGMLLTVSRHPNVMLADGKELLILETAFSGSAEGEWHQHVEVVSAELAFRPALVTPKPKIVGVESATVVGPPGEEIHTDEFGRVRVHFHWDRESKMDDNSSCWIHVSQPWGGTGYGGVSLPRIGQEVIVDFLGGDPDRPVVTGRLYTGVQKVPYGLPDNKTQSGWRSNSSPGGGGFNELLFEDKKGSELMYVQAEKDRVRLTKNDETITVGHDRSKHIERDESTQVDRDRSELVKRDEKITIGQDRTEMVQRDEKLTVANNRTRLVQVDESVTIGNDFTKMVVANSVSTIGQNMTNQIGMNKQEKVGLNRSRVVGLNESVMVGASQSITVAAAQKVAVGGVQAVSVGASSSVSVGGAASSNVGMTSTETVAIAKALSVGAAYQISVGGAMNTTVAMTQAEQVGKTKKITVGQKLEITVGASKITMEASGKITIEGTEILLKGGKHVQVESALIDLN